MTTAKKIPAAAPEKHRSLSFDFNAAARKAGQDFPEIKDKVLFINAKDDDWDETADILSAMDIDEEDLEEIGKTVRLAKRKQTSFHQELQDENEGIASSALVFYPDKFPVFGDKKGAVDDAGSFDHELGHALSPKTKGTLSENTADAFAALRNFQRFGQNPETLRYAGWKRAMIFMQSGATTHITTFTLDKILLDGRSADFMSLTPKQTAKIAKEYARVFTPDEKEIKTLSEAFQPLKKLPPKEAFKKLAAITLKADVTSQTFYLGARILKGAMAEGGQVLDGKHVALKGLEWETFAKKLDRKIAQLPKASPLRNVA